MSLGTGTQLIFRNFVEGTWGQFSPTSNGRVHYILTKARLGEESTDPERLLTQQLVPVREVMQAEDLDFNQLLQRDLDDHRVATQLIPYLLRPNPTGPAFFPPIVAVLLPFKGMKPSTFPSATATSTVTDEDGLTWQQTDVGDAFRVRQLATEAGGLHRRKVGQLWWNDVSSRLVVLDGQHRAMALLAIERTMGHSWQKSGGERYRYFYEEPVASLVASSGIDLNNVEVPVTVAWFPDQLGEEHRPHAAARKLFVDVNKEARQPSESRLILLSDAELLNVLTRSLLTSLRNDKTGDYLPLYAVEYDNPEVNTSRPARWSVLTNIHLLKNCVSRLVFGPPKYLTDVTLRIGSREGEAERDAFMRGQLQIDTDLLPPLVSEDGFSYPRDEIGNRKFPLGDADRLVDRFLETWGSSILTLFSQVEPYAAHSRALTAIKEKWLTDEAVSSLAYDALFNGVGMYWTLRDSSEFYRREQQLAIGKSKTAKPDIVKAWELITAKQTDFVTHRSVEYLGSSAKASLEKSEDAFQVMNTHACQLGSTFAVLRP